MLVQLNVENYRCPLPLMMTKKALKTLSVGDQLEVIFSRESAAENFIDFCIQHQCELQEKRILASHSFVIVFRKIV